MPTNNSTSTSPPRDRFIRLSEVEAISGCKKTTIYTMLRVGRFPRPVRMGRITVWPETAVHQWVQDRIAEAQAQ